MTVSGDLVFSWVGAFVEGYQSGGSDSYPRSNVVDKSEDHVGLVAGNKVLCSQQDVVKYDQGVNNNKLQVVDALQNNDNIFYGVPSPILSTNAYFETRSINDFILNNNSASSNVGDDQGDQDGYSLIFKRYKSSKQDDHTDTIVFVTKESKEAIESYEWANYVNGREDKAKFDLVNHNFVEGSLSCNIIPKSFVKITDNKKQNGRIFDIEIGSIFDDSQKYIYLPIYEDFADASAPTIVYRKFEVLGYGGNGSNKVTGIKDVGFALFEGGDLNRSVEESTIKQRFSSATSKDIKFNFSIRKDDESQITGEYERSKKITKINLNNKDLKVKDKERDWYQIHKPIDLSNAESFDKIKINGKEVKISIDEQGEPKIEFPDNGNTRFSNEGNNTKHSYNEVNIFDENNGSYSLSEDNNNGKQIKGIRLTLQKDNENGEPMSYECEIDLKTNKIRLLNACKRSEERTNALHQFATNTPVR